MRYLKGGMNQGAKSNLILKANLVRKNLTKQEKLLWDKLKNKQLNGLKFRNQHPIYIYILDFYCASHLLSIELDGESHKYTIEYDRERTEYLMNLGIKELRFCNEEIENNLTEVLNKIVFECNEREIKG